MPRFKSEAQRRAVMASVMRSKTPTTFIKSSEIVHRVGFHPQRVVLYSPSPGLWITAVKAKDEKGYYVLGRHGFNSYKDAMEDYEVRAKRLKDYLRTI